MAALAVGAQFSSASIYHGRGSEGRVHKIRGAGDLAFVIDAAGDIAERLMTWTMPRTRRSARRMAADLALNMGGGDARHFRHSMKARFGPDEVAAGRYSESLLVNLRPKIRKLARGLLIYPRHLPDSVAAAIAEVN